MWCRLFFFFQSEEAAVWLDVFGCLYLEAWWWWTLAQRRYWLARERCLLSSFDRRCKGTTAASCDEGNWQDGLSLLTPGVAYLSVPLTPAECPSSRSAYYHAQHGNTVRYIKKGKVMDPSIFLIVIVYGLVFMRVWVVMSRSPELPTPHSITCSPWLRASPRQLANEINITFCFTWFILHPDRGSLSLSLMKTYLGEEATPVHHLPAITLREALDIKFYRQFCHSEAVEPCIRRSAASTAPLLPVMLKRSIWLTTKTNRRWLLFSKWETYKKWSYRFSFASGEKKKKLVQYKHFQVTAPFFFPTDIHLITRK